MKITKEDIESFIPQRAPFVMIDNLLSATPDKIESDFKILPENIFLEEGTLREFALIENIAQTSAAGLFFINGGNVDKPVVEGFIGGISKLKVYGLPKVYDTIHTMVKPKASLGGMFLLKAENFVNGEKLMECEIKLVASNSKKNVNKLIT